jgi:hypothetical protein
VWTINYPSYVGGLAHGIYHKRFTAYRNVKETVPGSELSYQASDVRRSEHSRTEKREREIDSSIMFSKQPDRERFWKGRNEHKALRQASSQSVANCV